MDFEFSIAPSGKPRVDIMFDETELIDLRTADQKNGQEAVAAMARGAAALLLNRGILGDAVIVSPLYGLGFSVETSFHFLGTLRIVPGLEMDETK